VRARRELAEETGLSADPARVAFVLEAVAPDSSRRTLDIVFLATGLEPGREPHAREPGLEPHFVPAEQLNGLELRPPLAGICEA
jgi:8-oxo-dGTP diphosphatase